MEQMLTVCFLLLLVPFAYCAPSLTSSSLQLAATCDAAAAGEACTKTGSTGRQCIDLLLGKSEAEQYEEVCSTDCTDGFAKCIADAGCKDAPEFLKIITLISSCEKAEGQPPAMQVELQLDESRMNKNEIEDAKNIHKFFAKLATSESFLQAQKAKTEERERRSRHEASLHADLASFLEDGAGDKVFDGEKWCWYPSCFWPVQCDPCPPAPPPPAPTRVVPDSEIYLGSWMARTAYMTVDIIQHGEAGNPGLDRFGYTLKPDAFIDESASSDVQAFIAYPSDQNKDREIILSVRGTSSLMDAWIDLSFITADPVAADGAQIGTAGVLHSGFKRQFNGMLPKMKAHLDDLWAQGYRKLLVSGHSLGGAVCTLAASYIRINRPGWAVKVVTLGSPRVGDQYFVNQYMNLVPAHERLSDTNDPVPCVPLETQGFANINQALLWDGSQWVIGATSCDWDWLTHVTVNEHLFTAYGPHVKVFNVLNVPGEIY